MQRLCKVARLFQIRKPHQSIQFGKHGFPVTLPLFQAIPVRCGQVPYLLVQKPVKITSVCKISGKVREFFRHIRHCAMIIETFQCSRFRLLSIQRTERIADMIKLLPEMIF